MGPRRSVAFVLSALVVLAVVAALSACGSSATVDEADEPEEPPGSTAVPGSIALASPGPSESADRPLGMYAELTYGTGHLLLWNDGRYTYSNTEEFTHGTFTYDPGSRVVGIPALVGSVEFSPADGTLTLATAAAGDVVYVPLPQQPADVAEAADRPWNELDDEHQRRFDDMDAIVAQMKAEADAIAAERGTDTTFDPMLLDGTWGTDGDDITVTIDAREGVWHSGRGLTFSYGSLQVSGLTVVFLRGPDPQHPEDLGPPGACPMGNGATYDPQTGELVGEAGGRWRSGASEPAADPNAPW